MRPYRSLRITVWAHFFNVFHGADLRKIRLTFRKMFHPDTGISALSIKERNQVFAQFNPVFDRTGWKQQEQDLKEIEEQEFIEQPAPEIEQPEPTPQYESATEMLNQYEQAATPSNDTVQQNEPMEKSPDQGMGY